MAASKGISLDSILGVSSWVTPSLHSCTLGRCYFGLVFASTQILKPSGTDLWGFISGRRARWYSMLFPLFSVCL